MFDLIIKNGTIIDGTGKKRFRADIGIKKDRIKVIDNIKGAHAWKTIDAKDQFVVPGFIDILNHTDGYLTFLSIPTVNSMVGQGVTTMICGNCGTSPAPFAAKSTLKDLLKMSFFKTNVIMPPSRGGDLLRSMRRWASIFGINISWITFEEYLTEIKRKGISANFGTLIGYNTIRRGIVGDEIRDLSHEEIKISKNTAIDALSHGALGISFGLAYSHTNFVKSEELHSIILILKGEQKFCSIHLRNEGSKIYEAILEAIELAEKNKVSVEISHFKITDKNLWNRIDELLNLFKEAKKRGVNINFDVYPYNRGWFALYSYLPSWISRGGREELLKKLSDKKLRSKIFDAIEAAPLNFGNFIVAFSPHNKIFVGKTISEIAKSHGFKISETVIDLLVSSKGHVICFSGDDFISGENLKKEILHSQSIVSSAGAAYNLAYKKEEQLVHPRCFGAFPKFLRKYVCESQLLSWEEAIKKITFFPAKKIGLNSRGKIAQGMKADITIFNPEKLSDRATYINPFRLPLGLNYVVVNGQIVVEGGKHTGKLAGEVLKA
jgi:N-acyl-D-amino-acid deacylase